MHCDRLQGPINLSISLSFLREAHDYHLLGHRERSPRGQHTAHALPAGSHQEVRREPANTFPVIISPPQNDFPWRGWGRGRRQQAAQKSQRGSVNCPDSWRRRAGGSLGAAGSGRAWKMAAEPSVGGTGPPVLRPAAGAARVALTHCPRPLGYRREGGRSADTHRVQRSAPSDLALVGPDIRLAGSGWSAPSLCPHPICWETAWARRFLWPRLAWRKSRGQSRRRRSSHLASRRSLPEAGSPRGP